MSTPTLSNLANRARLLLALLLALSPASRAFAADTDPMAPYRERFKAGMERYKAGDLPAAIDDWESIYREVGPDKGYRVAFDLARAYDRSGDEARAAERYESFLHAAGDRRASGLASEPVVQKEETDARLRLDQIIAAKGRLHVEPGTAPVQARVDALEARPAPFTAYVPPGAHVVTFDPGGASEAQQNVTVAAGEIIDVTPPPPKPPPPPPVPVPATVLAPAPAPPPLPPPTPPPTIVKEEPRPEHPFSPVFVFAAGGAAVAAVAVCAVEYSRALSAADAFNAAAGDPPSVQRNLRSTYDGIRPLAYGSLGASLGLVTITGALTAWYFAGTRGTGAEVSVAPTVSAAEGGAQAGVVGRF